VKLINKHLSSDKEWKVFEANFDLIHDRFFRNLKERAAQLTPRDLKLCAYLRLNLTTKEIAQLTGNSVRGVEVARFRLRKKLQLAPEQNLNEFMLEFKG
jgi:DNA-binding NarL/FixJ family response regulator